MSKEKCFGVVFFSSSFSLHNYDLRADERPGQKLHLLVQTDTQTHTDMATLWLNRPSGANLVNSPNWSLTKSVVKILATFKCIMQFRCPSIFRIIKPILSPLFNRPGVATAVLQTWIWARSKTTLHRKLWNGFQPVKTLFNMQITLKTKVTQFF